MRESLISIESGFQTSINIAYDLKNQDKIKGFIPTLSALDVIEEIILSTADNSTQRARMLIGAYGRGKSHIVLVLLALLRLKDVGLFTTILNKTKESNPNLYNFILEYINSPKKILPIVVSGNSSSLTQSFLSALQQALSGEDLADLMPDTHFVAAVNAINNWEENYPKTFNKFSSLLGVSINDFILKLKEFDVDAFSQFQRFYPQLTSGSEFNPFLGFDVVELYEKVVDKLSENGYSGVYIVFDEFSKYLESSISSASLSDIKLLQDFAEKCNRSGKKQIHLMLICHKDISNYIDSSLAKEKVDGWRGVSGRFTHISLHNNYTQMYEIISAVIKKDPAGWLEYEETHQRKFNDLTTRFAANGLLDKMDAGSTRAAIVGCYPLHPISTFILPRLSEKVAQNERTLFTFLSSNEKNTLVAFVKNSATSDFVMLTPDIIYDYFEPLLRKEPYTSATHQQYKLTESVLRRIDENSLGAKIIKTISLIYIVEQFEKLPPLVDMITDAYRDSVKDIKEISDAISDLMDKECLVYLRRSNNYLKLKESSGVDIQREIARTIENLRAMESVTVILNAFSFDNYFYPTRYNDEKEIVRYFDFVFISSKEFWSITDWYEYLTSTTSADGVVLAVIPSGEEDIKRIKERVTSPSMALPQLVVIVPTIYKEIEAVTFEYSAVKKLRALAADDAVLSDEYDVYIEDLEEVIYSYICIFTRPELGLASFYYNCELEKVRRKAQVSELLSRICEALFPNTPIINNESINKNDLPTVAINSRTKLLNGLLADEFSSNLGLSGSGQDVSIMRSTLIQTGIMSDVETVPVLVTNPSDESINRMLSVIADFFKTAKTDGGSSFALLYDELTLPGRQGIGLKRGVIPIYIAVVLHEYKKNIVITHNGQEMKLNADLLNSINENPASYSAISVVWNDEKRQYMMELESIFSDFIVEKEKTYNSFSYLVFAMNRWYMSLPKYAKEMEVIYRGKDHPPEKIPKDKRKFINSLKQPDANAREYLFVKIFDIFNLREFNPVVVDAIRHAKQIYDDAKSSLIAILCSEVKSIFSPASSKSSVCSAAKDWYETLNDNTLNHLFTGNESRILEVFKSVTSNDVQFIERLGKVTCSLRIDDWNIKTIPPFLDDIISFKEAVDTFNNQSKQSTVSSDEYRISFINEAGKEITKSFAKVEYSSRARLLLNAVSNAVDEMGESITEQEKRQVLIEILEKLC
ncbi:hypothetical protein SDC9_44346 [bioreactor metagenome]|uniref:Uncharacterized protein n=1 Tax=bioreactor metagenome TaxID=1076179 RepID=A0A644W3P1_9ZZZZ